MMTETQVPPGVPVAMIAAVGANGVIGRGNAMPWRIPSDLKRFKALTLGKPVVMGRRTLESIGAPLPGRTNIVVSRRPDFAPQGVRVARSLTEALAMAGEVAAATGAGEIIIGGGAEIYREAMPLADRLYVSAIDLAPEGDARFPVVDPAEWRVLSEERPAPGPRDEAPHRFVIYERISRLR